MLSGRLPRVRPVPRGRSASGAWRSTAAPRTSEPFSHAEAALRFEGAGVRLDGLEMGKGGGHVTGAAYVGWNGTYSFNADGRGLAVETLDAHVVSRLSDALGADGLHGERQRHVRRCRATTSKGSVRDLFIGDEGIGQMTGRLAMRGTLMTYEFEAASSRLAVSGNGRVELTDEMDAEMSFRVTDTSLDPYVRAFQPQLSPYTSAVASGTIRVVGELYNPDALRIETSVEQVDLRLLRLQAAQPGADPVERGSAGAPGRCPQGRGRRHGTRSHGHRRSHDPGAGPAAPTAPPTWPCCRGSCPTCGVRAAPRSRRASAAPRRPPIVSGNALLTDGRLRTFAFPNALENINGIVTFDANGHPGRRPHGAAWQRTGPLRRAHRDVRVSPERVRRDRRGRGHAAAVPRGHALARGRARWPCRDPRTRR